MEQDVFRLDIAVDDVLPVHVLHRLADLPHDLADGAFGQSLAAMRESAVEVLAETGLEEEVDAVVVDVVVVEADDVGVGEEGLDLELTHQLVHVQLPDLQLGNHLHREYAPRRRVPALAREYRTR
jgi:hypothetical protein